MADMHYNYVGCGDLFISGQDYNWNGQNDVTNIKLDISASEMNIEA